MNENYTPQEQEYDEIFMIFQFYHEKYPKAIKEIDQNMMESINQSNPKLVAMINLHWHFYSLADSVIMMNTNRNYRGASIFLRSMMEIMLLILYFDKYPDEARRWNDFQTMLINKVLKIDTKTYFDYIYQTFEEFEKHIKKKGYRDTSHLTQKYYKEALKFNPSFIRWNVDYERYFTDVTNIDLILLSDIYYDIFSKDVHLSFTIFELIDKDIEVELEYLKTALSFTEIVLKIIFQEIQPIISEEATNEIQLSLLSMLKVLDKNAFNKLIDKMSESSDDDKEKIQDIKNKGFIQLPVHKGCRIVHDANRPLRDDLVKEYQTEKRQNPERTNFYFDLEKRYREISNKMIHIISNVDINEIEGIENKELLTILSAILFNNSILVHTITDLNYYRKYSESQAILRLIVESAQLVLYFHQHPYEVERWGDFQQLCIQRTVNSEDTKWYIKLDYDGFISYLREKGYPHEIFDLIDGKNYTSSKLFAPSFIHKQIDYDTINKDKDIKGMFHELADILSLYSHPSEVISSYKNERLIEEEIFLLDNALWMYIIMIDTILSRYQKYFSKQEIDDLVELIGKPK